jgi:hypothetical protein
VCVDGQPVMTMTLDKDSVTVKEDSFPLSNHTAVMQVLTADNGDPLVLMTVMLSFLPDSGVTVPLPLYQTASTWNSRS